MTMVCVPCSVTGCAVRACVYACCTYRDSLFLETKILGACVFVCVLYLPGFPVSGTEDCSPETEKPLFLRPIHIYNKTK